MVSCEYRDLYVTLWADESPGFFRARAQEEFGEKTEPLRVYLPFHDRWFIQYADSLGELNGRELHYVGARLFESLFRGEILRLYVHLLDQVRNTGARLRLRLAIEPPIVARLPWECLYDTRNEMFVTGSSDVTMVRYMTPAEREPASVPLHPPLKVLVVSDGRSERLSLDARVARRALAELEAEATLSVFEAGAGFDGPELSLSALETVLARKFDVLHFFLPCEWEADQGQFVLGNDAVAIDAFARMISAQAPSVVIWSGGESVGPAGPSLAQGLLRRVPALIAHRRPMPEELLERHTTAFYRALSSLTAIDDALGEARSAAMSQVPAEGEWVAPAVFLARRDANALTSASRGGVTDMHQVSEGRYRRHLRETLNRLWLKPDAYFPQKVQWTPGADSASESLASYMQATELIAEPQTVAELTRRFQRLWITGPPGSGKTMALRRLFYEAAQPVLSYESRSPMPVYVALPDVEEGTDLFETLAVGFDRTLFSSDLEEGRFLFLLDAADGLTARGAARYAQALNHFMRRYPLNRFVVTTRGRPPFAIEVPNRAQMLPLAEWEALEFLIAGESVRPEPARTLRQQLSEKLGTKASNPQILTFARRLWRAGARVPDSATGIFLAFFKKACASSRADIRESLLPQLAFFMSREGRLSLLKEHLEEQSEREGLGRLAQDIAFRGMGAYGPDELLAEIEKTRLFRGPGAYRFSSLAFQEFLTAYAIRFAAPNTILGLVSSADWRELGGDEEAPLNMNRGAFHGALPFVCGLREDGSVLVERLADRDLVLASACYRETRASSSADLVLRAAVERGLASKLELDQRVAVMSLEARGDNWAVDWLENIAARGDNAGRALAIAGLGNLGASRSARVLEAASTDSDPLVARTAADALSRIRTG